MTIELPSILGMHFRPSTGDCQSAVMSDDFWPIYKAERDELRAAGITIGTDDENVWHVRYNPRFDRTGADTLLPQLEAAYAGKISEAREARAAAERQKEINRENARRAHEDWLDSEADTIRQVVLGANRLLATYGDAVVGKAAIAKLLAVPVTPSSIADIRQLCTAAEKRIHSRALRASQATGGVDWSDELVVRAVTLLTIFDVDHAKDRDGKGWSAGHTAMGHWCAGALKDDRYRDAAMKLARCIVGHYVDQLSSHMPEVAPKGRAA